MRLIARCYLEVFQTDMLGIAMQRYNESGYNKHSVYVIDDWC